MLDAKICSSSSTCYAITDVPYILNGTDLLNKTSLAWTKSNGTYLARYINNSYVSSYNVSQIAIGYSSVCSEYYDILDADRYSFYSPVYLWQYNSVAAYVNYGNAAPAVWNAFSTPASTSLFAKDSTYCYTRGAYKYYTSGWWYYSVGRIRMVR